MSVAVLRCTGVCAACLLCVKQPTADVGMGDQGPIGDPGGRLWLVRKMRYCPCMYKFLWQGLAVLRYASNGRACARRKWKLTAALEQSQVGRKSREAGRQTRANKMWGAGS